MKNGVTQQLGAPCDVYYRPRNRFVAEFIGKHTVFDAMVEDVSGSICTVSLQDGTRLQGLKENSAPDVTFAVGMPVQVALRPECLELANGPAENTLKGTVLHCEFTGMSANYLLSVAGKTLKATFVNHIPNTSVVGTPLNAFVPMERMYFLKGEDRA